MKPELIKSIEQLKEEATEGEDFFILLRIGRSSKHITYNSKENNFEILNEIDDTTQILTEKEIQDKEHTMIGETIKHGSFYKYNY